MKEIKLKQGQSTIVDDEDFDYLNQWSWVLTDKGYARSSYKKQMHRLIMNINDPNIQIDHKNGNKLDNRKNNLRLVTNQENQFNQKKRNTSNKFKGVRLNKKANKYVSYITLNYKRIHLGYFENEIEAAKAYDKKAIELFGEYACTNEMLGLYV